jgi:dienelactone hydrolase
LRRFELVLAFAAVFAIGWPVVFGVRPRRGIVAGSLLVALIAQLQIEGYRWQLIPLYVVGVGLAIGDVFFIDRGIDWSRRIIRGVLGSIGLLVAISLPLVLPVPRLPAPAGPEAIGTFELDLVDRARTELYGSGGAREIAVQVWYPAVADEGAERVAWSQHWEAVAPAISENLRLPSWFLDHTRYTLSHATSSPRMAEGRYPVVIFSHGWEEVRTIAVNQIEHLVSNGYIVIAPDHTYGAAATVIEGTGVVYEDENALPDKQEVGDDAYLEAATDLLSTFSGDLVMILDGLDAGESGPFGAIIDGADLNRIGIYGHGVGGGAAVKTCLEDERCDAVLGLDPWVEPLTEVDLQLTMARPAFYMRSDEWIDTDNDALLRGIAARGADVTYLAGVEGTTSNDFIATPLLSPLTTRFGLRGEIPSGRIIPIIDNYLLGFFDVYLLGTGSAALDSVTFPEVTMTVIQS